MNCKNKNKCNISMYIIASLLLISIFLSSAQMNLMAPENDGKIREDCKIIQIKDVKTGQEPSQNLEDQLWISEEIGQGFYAQSIIDDNGSIFSVYRTGDYNGNNTVCYKILNFTTKLWSSENVLVDGTFKIIEYQYGFYDNCMRIIGGLPSIFIVNSEGNQEIRLYQYNYTSSIWEQKLTIPKENATAEIKRFYVEIDNNEDLHVAWVENNTSALAFHYQKFNSTDQTWSNILTFEPGFVHNLELMIKIANGNIPIIMARISGVLTFYKIVDGSIETIVSYSDIGNTCRNTFDVDDSGKLHIIKSYTGKYIVYPDGDSYPLPYDMITAIDFFSVNCGTPYLVIAPEHYLFINGEWVLNRTVVFGSFNSLLWENRVIMHRTSIEGGKLYSHILRSKYSPQVFMESECEYSTKHSLTVHDDELRFNASYSLMVNSSVVSNGIISSDASIFETSGLEIGDYNFTLNFEDGYGNSFNNSKIVRIVNKKPVITRNFQQIFVKGEIFSLNWTVVDNSVRNPVYSIFINGDLLITNEALSSDEISLDISSLLPGTYQVKLIVNDGLGGMAELISGIIVQAVPEKDNDNEENSQSTDNMAVVYGIIGSIGLMSVIGMGIRIGIKKNADKNKNLKKTASRDTNNLIKEEKNESS